MRDMFNRWWRAFVEKHRLSISSPDDGTERWYMYISPARILTGLVSLVLLIAVAVVILIIYTPLMDTIPGYPGRRSRELLIDNIMRLDSLQREMEHITVYSDNIALIMEGKTPVIRDVTRMGDSVEIRDRELVLRSMADSLLRASMEGTGEYSLAASAAAVRPGGTVRELTPPAGGLVQSRFSPVDGRFGVEIATAANQPVVAVGDGSVVLSVWTPSDGHIVQIQHLDNLISVYKHLSQVSHGVGVRLKAGEIIGVAGSVDGNVPGSTGPLDFELWYNGTPVDPENHIVF
ncbi:MAG: M23 family metallopeptidase [Alistipes sp.]|jgi:hypothetical protein|nr:M23 family metallopeptidase [Alistipes sp.]